jgi:hypothetical protein
MNLRTLCVILAGAPAFLAACGGSATDDLVRATPSFDSMSMDISDLDAEAPATSTALTIDEAPADLSAADACHPHLFLRTHDIVDATNAAIWHILRPIGLAGRIAPRRHDHRTGVWERVIDGFTFRYTVTKTGDQSFTAELDVKHAADPDTAFVTVYSATLERDPSTHDGSGNATLDLDALDSVTGDGATGKLVVSFDAQPASKKVIATMTNLSNNGERPRTGKYVFFKEAGKGGSLKFVDTLALGCPGPGGSSTGTTPVSAVARFILAANGQVHFRADAEATGGQIAAGDKWEGVTCALSSDRRHHPAESFWMMKLEDPTGATVQGSSRQSSGVTAAACDALFGPVPAVDNAATDFDFSTVDFTSDDPLPFPGM